MRILFLRPFPALPESYAGTQVNLHCLCLKLKADGHTPIIAAATNLANPGDAPAADRDCGYAVVRAHHVLVAARATVESFQPDVLVVTQPGPWLEGLPPEISKTPIIVYENEVSDGLEGAPENLRARALYAANSAITRAHLSQDFKVESTIVRPLFGVRQYEGVQRSGDNVLFVSLQPRKGSGIALAIANSRPQVKFICVETWTRDDDGTQGLRKLAGSLSNVRLLANQQGLVNVMPHVKLLIMPSRGNESWGRTATEAQICGIPVLASNRGNLPNTIGEGGINVDPDAPLETWLAAFDSIMGSPAGYEEYSRKALAHGRAMIAQIEPAYQAFVKLAETAIAKGRV